MRCLPRAGLACVSSLLMLAPDSHAAAQPPAQNGGVTFAAKRAGKPVIYVRAAGGGGLRVVPTGGWADKPAVSPGGARMAFRRVGRLGSQIWITHLNGTGLRQLTAGPADGGPAWSPEGDAIAFARGRAGLRDIHVIDAAGTWTRRLTYSRADDHSPSWSVTGRVAFVRRSGGRGRLYVIAARGGRARPISNGRADDRSPAWSPTARRLAFARGRPGRHDLYLATADGSRTRRLTALPGDETEPAWSPDGRWLAFAHRRGGRRRVYLMRLRRTPIRGRDARGVRVLASTRTAAHSPHWQPTGLDPVVAAAGDIACDPLNRYFGAGQGQGAFCRQRATSDLLLRMDLAAVLAPGDLQYEDGKLWKFERSFDPSWGRVKALIRPVPGNHEYEDPGAAGYFDYFNGPGVHTGQAGRRDQGYYSFDVGAWHVVALNSECTVIGGCGPDSPQVRWLKANLGAHPADCTLAFWHHPRFTSGRHSAEGSMYPIWQALYEADADLVVNGHEHFYERFRPQTADGIPDAARGLRQFIVGTGGRSRFGYVTVAANSELRENRYHGVLELTLRNDSYDWRLVTAPRGRAADSGTASCH